MGKNADALHGTGVIVSIRFGRLTDSLVEHLNRTRDPDGIRLGPWGHLPKRKKERACSAVLSWFSIT